MLAAKQDNQLNAYQEGEEKADGLGAFFLAFGKDEAVIRVYPSLYEWKTLPPVSVLSRAGVSKGHLLCVSLCVSWSVFH